MGFVSTKWNYRNSFFGWNVIQFVCKNGRCQQAISILFLLLVFLYASIFAYVHNTNRNCTKTQRTHIVTKQIRYDTIFSRDVIYMTQNKNKTKKNYNSRTAYDSRIKENIIVCASATMWRVRISKIFFDDDIRLYFWSRKLIFTLVVYVIPFYKFFFFSILSSHSFVCFYYIVRWSRFESVSK